MSVTFFVSCHAYSQNETELNTQEYAEILNGLDAVVENFYGRSASFPEMQQVFAEAFLMNLLGDRLRFLGADALQQVHSQFGDLYSERILLLLTSSDGWDPVRVASFLEAVTEDVIQIESFVEEMLKTESVDSLESFLNERGVANWLAQIVISFKRYALSAHPNSTEDADRVFDRQIQFLKRRVSNHKEEALFKGLRDANFLAVDKYWGPFKVPQPGGVGIFLREVSNGLEVTASYNSKIKTGDVITHFSEMGEKSITNVESEISQIDGYSGLLNKIRGADGDVLHLWLNRGGQSLQVSVVRRVQGFVQAIVDHGNMNNDIKIDSQKIISLGKLFLDKHTLEQALKRVAAIQSTGERQVYIDLRNNPGGDLRETIKFLSAFTRREVLVVSEERHGENIQYKSEPSIYDFRNMEVIVLVNENTASAAEIIAGVLQKSGGIVVGTGSTYGKGSVQEVNRIGRSPFRQAFMGKEKVDELRVKATVAEYFLFDERIKVDGVGVIPDTLVKSWDGLRASDITSPSSLFDGRNARGARSCQNIF